MPAAAAPKANGGRGPVKPKVILSNNSIIKGLGPKPGGVVKRRKSGAALQLAGNWCAAFELSRLYSATAAAAMIQPLAAIRRMLHSNFRYELTLCSLAALLKQRTPRSQPICGKWKHGRGKHARMMMHGAPWSSSACTRLPLLWITM